MSGGGDRLIPPTGLVPWAPVVVPALVGVATTPGLVPVAPFPVGLAAAVVERLRPPAPVVYPGQLAPAVRLVVGAPVRLVVVTCAAVVLFVPGPADVGPVGTGRRERRYLGSADDGSPPARGGSWGVLDTDIAGVALAGELGAPLVGRLDHPGRLGGMMPSVTVAAVHPRVPSPVGTRVLP